MSLVSRHVISVPWLSPFFATLPLQCIILTANQKWARPWSRTNILVSFRVHLCHISVIQKCLPIAARELHLKGTLCWLVFLLTPNDLLCCLSTYYYMYWVVEGSGEKKIQKQVHEPWSSPHLFKMKDNPCPGWLPQFSQRLLLYLLGLCTTPTLDCIS